MTLAEMTQKNKLQRLVLSIRHTDKHTVFCCSLRLEEIRTNKTYVHKSWYAKHDLGYCNLVYYKWQRHDYRNPTKKHFKLHNLMSFFEVK